MTAVLVALPTARPAVADDHDDRTQLFRHNQKRPTWKDVERARAPAVRLVPAPNTRVSLERAPFIPPYLRKGYWNKDWAAPSAPLGEKCHEAMKRDMEKAAVIRSMPKSLTKLLATPEWKGSEVLSFDSAPGWVTLVHPSGARMRLNVDALYG